MLGVVLTFVGIALISDGMLILGKASTKTISFINIVAAIIIVGENFIGLFHAMKI